MEGTVDEEGLEKLRFLFSDTLLLAALDLVDRENGESPWMYCQISLIDSNFSDQIQDSLGRYTV